MTPEQVWKYVEEKAKRPAVGEFMQRCLNSMNYYRDKGFTFTCKGGTLIASKEGEEDYFFEFGSLQEDIERMRIPDCFSVLVSKACKGDEQSKKELLKVFSEEEVERLISINLKENR